MQHLNERRFPLLLAVASFLVGFLALQVKADESHVLVTVNGTQITTLDLDRILEETHKQMSMEGMRDFDPRRLITKSVNDELLWQEAEALGMGEEKQILDEVETIRVKAASRVYGEDHVSAPPRVSEERIRHEFEIYYWKIQLRQVTLRGKPEAESARQAVISGADMDSLARAVSLDVHKNRGGLHNLKFWRDVELEMRPPALEMEPGDISELFLYREVWSFVRCEDRSGLQEDYFPVIEPSIRQVLGQWDAQALKDAFVDSLRVVYPIEEHPDVLAAIEADAEVVLKGKFLRGSERPALSLDDGTAITEAELRKAVSRRAMTDGEAPFEDVFAEGVRVMSVRLVVERAAREAGYFENPEVVAGVEQKRRSMMIQQYLDEIILSRIVFRQEELDAFYQDHLDDFRGDDEVLIDVMIVSDEETALEIGSRLKDGADFDFIRQQFELGDSGQANWSPVSVFSIPMREQIATLEIGEASSVLEIPTGYMFFQLEGRRPGQAQSFEEVAMEVRGAVFQLEFNRLLDEHLKLLGEHSEIIYDEDAISAYFAS